MARYKVGQQLVTVGFVFADEYFGVIRRPYRSNMFVGLDTTPVLKTEVIRLTIVEHHKVPGEWSDALEYDGYVLRDENGALKMVHEYRSHDTDYEPHKEGCLFVMTSDRFEVTEDIDLSALSFYIKELLRSRDFDPKPVPYAVYQKCAAEFKLAQKLLDIRVVYSNDEMHALTNILTLSEPGVPLSMLAPHPVAYALPGVRTAYEGNEGA